MFVTYEVIGFVCQFHRVFLLQETFISMKAVSFVGGHPRDKTVFAIVHEDKLKNKRVRLYQTRGEPVYELFLPKFQIHFVFP